MKILISILIILALVQTYCMVKIAERQVLMADISSYVKQVHWQAQDVLAGVSVGNKAHARGADTVACRVLVMLDGD